MLTRQKTESQYSKEKAEKRSHNVVTRAYRTLRPLDHRITTFPLDPRRVSWAFLAVTGDMAFVK